MRLETFWGWDTFLELGHLGLGTFRGLGHFEAWDVLELGRLGLGRFGAWDVL